MEKEKIKAAFVGFFKPKDSNSKNTKKESDNSVLDENSYFMPFQVNILFHTIIIQFFLSHQ